MATAAEEKNRRCMPDDRRAVFFAGFVNHPHRRRVSCPSPEITGTRTPDSEPNESGLFLLHPEIDT